VNCLAMTELEMPSSKVPITAAIDVQKGSGVIIGGLIDVVPA